MTHPQDARTKRRERAVGALIGLALAVCLVLGAWLGWRVFAELHFLHSAPRDNVQWAASQLETEAARMQMAAIEARSGSPEGLDEFRKRFDIFYSRVGLIRSGAMFESLRQSPEVIAELEVLTDFLDQTVPAIDGPDGALAAALPDILSRIKETQPVTRDFALAIVASFARQSDRERVIFSELLTLTSMVGLAVIVLLLVTATILFRQIRLARRSVEEARRSEARLASMIDSALDAVIVMDANGRIVNFNPAAASTFGYSRDQTIGQPLVELIIPPRYREAHRAGLERYLNHGEARVVGKGRIELSALDAEQREFPVELAVGESVGEDGPIFVAYLRDITRRKEVETTLREARDRAEAADRAKSDFLAVMSHEMRTPLNGVLGAVDLLRSTPLAEKQRRYVELAEKSGEILLQHISDVLDLTKIETGRLEIEAEPFDPAALVSELAVVTREEAVKRDNEITLEITGQIPAWVKGDAHRIRQVLLNLVTNAIKFTSEGNITVGLRPAEATGSLEFFVEDTGIGIAEEDRSHLFEEFVILNPSYTREVGGAGLGLAICRRIVHALRGEIGVESELGAGSRFWFRIPLSETAAPESQAREALATAPSMSGTVLLAEDNETNRIIASEMLVNAGYSVQVAEDGAEAVKLAERTAFDLILMDVSMPRMDGVEATKRIRRGDGVSRAAPILAMTAHAAPSEVERFLGAGMQGCLTKPLRLNHMVAAIAEIGNAGSGAGLGAGKRDRAMEDTSSADSEGGLPVIEAEGLTRLRTELSPETLVRALGRFREELEDSRHRIAAALEVGDKKGARQLAHRLSGAAAAVGAARLAKCSAELEGLCGDTGGEINPKAVQQLEAACDATLNAVAEALAVLPAPSK